MNSSDLAVIGYAVYILPLIVLYVLELVVIVNYRKQTFSSSFFKIFAVLALVFGSFVFRLNLYSIVNGFYANLMTTSTWLTVAYVGAYYLNCLSESLGALLAINRFTALFFPLQHDHMWHWRMFSGCVLLCSLISIAPIWFLLDNSTTFVQYTEYGQDFFVVGAISPTRQGSIWFNMAMVTLCCTGLSTVLYIACAVRLYTSLGTRNRIAERNLFLAGFFSMMFSIPHMIAMVSFYLNLTIGLANGSFDHNIMSFFTFQLPWLTDLKYLTPGPVLLITNKSIRNKILKMSSTIPYVTVTVIKVETSSPRTHSSTHASK